MKKLIIILFLNFLHFTCKAQVSNDSLILKKITELINNKFNDIRNKVVIYSKNDKYIIICPNKIVWYSDSLGVEKQTEIHYSVNVKCPNSKQLLYFIQEAHVHTKYIYVYQNLNQFCFYKYPIFLNKKYRNSKSKKYIGNRLNKDVLKKFISQWGTI
jgi:hypothetical protein